MWRTHSRRRARSPWNSGSEDAASLSYRRELLKPRNFLDYFRAAGGAWALMGGYGIEPALRVDPNAEGGGNVRVLLLQAAIFTLGLLFQVVRFERGRLALTAPVFYLGGLVLLTCGPIAGLSGFVLAWFMTPVFPNVQAFLAILSCVVFLVSYFLAGLQPLAAVGFVLCWVPIVLSMLFRRPLIVFSRRTPAPTREVAT
jgi:hypothetical protein